jgi:hypothetical protein
LEVEVVPVDDDVEHEGHSSVDSSHDWQDEEDDVEHELQPLVKPLWHSSQSLSKSHAHTLLM